MSIEVFKTKQKLSQCLKSIEENDTNYDIRYNLVIRAFYLANKLGYKTGIRVDASELDWPIYVIELPNDKQISWHMPSHKIPYDGHTTEEKYERCREYSKNYAEDHFTNIIGYKNVVYRCDG
jgi:hypothetical protein